MPHNGAKFWITYVVVRLLRKASRWQLIQNSAPSTIVWRQCDIRIVLRSTTVQWCLAKRRIFTHLSSIDVCSYFKQPHWLCFAFLPGHLLLKKPLRFTGFINYNYTQLVLTRLFCVLRLFYSILVCFQRYWWCKWWSTSNVTGTPKSGSIVRTTKIRQFAI